MEHIFLEEPPRWTATRVANLKRTPFVNNYSQTRRGRYITSPTSTVPRRWRDTHPYVMRVKNYSRETGVTNSTCQMNTGNTRNSFPRHYPHLSPCRTNTSEGSARPITASNEQCRTLHQNTQLPTERDRKCESLKKPRLTRCSQTT